MSLLNYTSGVDADKTAQEISKCLSLHGAQAVLTEYDPKSQYLIGISFRIKVGEQLISFRLPCDWKPVYAVMYKSNRSVNNRIRSNREMQAIRTAWRIVKDWVEAQMALVETQMAKTEEVFLPYAVMKDNRTLAEHVASGQFLLGNGSN